MAEPLRRLENDTEDGFTLRCPVDGRPMNTFQVGMFTVDRCEDCGGMWLDLNEVHRLLAIKGEAMKIDAVKSPASRPGSGRQKRYCPRDKAEMVTLHNLPQVHVEYEQCPVCGGMFLDRGELNDLNSYSVVERLRNLFVNHE